MLARVDASVRLKATRVIEAVVSADQVDEYTPRPPGWSDRKYRAALDARKCSKEAPAYIGIAEKVLSSFKRSEANRPPASPLLHADVRVYVRGDVTVAYQTLDVTENE